LVTDEELMTITAVDFPTVESLEDDAICA